MNIEDIMKTAKDFPVGVSGDQAFPYAVLLQDYDGLKNPNDQFDYIKIQNQQDVLEDLAKKRFEFLALRDDIKYILKHRDDFQNTDGTSVEREKLSKDFDVVVDAINTMQKEASACTRDPNKCEFTKFDVSKFNLPIPKAEEWPDIAGSYKLSDGSRVVQFEQNGRFITCHDPTPNFDHLVQGEWNGSFFDCTVTRRNLQDGCVTQMSQKITVPDQGVLKCEVINTDGKCDLPQNFTGISTWFKN
ncbi:MAG: hypothetical protein HC936_01305 [Leptolyngbyaceae cyanobacterium SU_3_3]|nr:hypothetical protein [Leptolyngbyaceae cyanobacterium SU_3_3]